jgi:hypothetical protein
MMMPFWNGENIKFSIGQFLILLLLVLLVSCRDKTTENSSAIIDIADGGFLSQDPCGPPCLWSIVPDLSTDLDAKKIVQEHIDIHNCEQWPKKDTDKAIICGSLALQFSEFHKVTTIAFSPSQRITMRQVIQEYGEPNAVGVDVFKAGYSNSGDKTTVWMDIFFDDIRTIIHMPEQEGEQYILDEESPIGGIAYLGQDKWGSKRLLAKPWNGFHPYEGGVVSPNP